MINVYEQTLDYDLVNDYIASLPGYEHTKLVTIHELNTEKDLYTYRYGEKPEDGPMGFPVASYRDEEGNLYVTQTYYNLHTLTIATTGKGKTMGVVLNMAFNADKRCSYIFTDPKNEVCKLSYNYLKEQYGEENIDIINFLDPKQSTAFFNPFTDLAYEWVNSRRKENRDEIRSNIISEIDKICETLYPISQGKDPTWEKTARSLIQAIYYGLFEDLDLVTRKSSQMKRKRIEPEEINFATVEKIFHSITYERFNVNDNGFFSEREKTSLAYTTSYSILHNADTTRANYFGFADLFVKMYSDAKIQEISKYNTVKAEDYAMSPKVLFAIYNIADEKVREFVNICMARLVSKLLELSHKNGEDIALKTPIHFVLDEFDSLRPCDVYKDVLTLGRASNLFMHMFIQSYQQLSANYPDKWLTMLENTDQIFLGTNGDETAEKFAKGLGKCAKADPAAYLIGTLRVVEMPVVTQDDLHRLKRGESYVKRNGAMPLKVGYSLYYQTDEYKKYGIKDIGNFKEANYAKTEECILDVDDEKFAIKEDSKNVFSETFPIKNGDKENKDFLSDSDEAPETLMHNYVNYGDATRSLAKEKATNLEANEEKAVRKLLTRKYVFKSNAKFEEEAMDVIEIVVSVSPSYTRLDAIELLEQILKESRQMLDENAIKVLERAKKELQLATDKEYATLKAVLFDTE